MEVRFFTLGVIDLIAGIILFFDISMIVKIISIVLIAKGLITVVKAWQH